MNGPRFQAADRAEERNLDLDISVLLAFIIQDLNAVIEELRLISVVNIIRIVKLDGSGARVAGNLFHLEILR